MPAVLLWLGKKYGPGKCSSSREGSASKISWQTHCLWPATVTALREFVDLDDLEGHKHVTSWYALTTKYQWETVFAYQHKYTITYPVSIFFFFLEKCLRLVNSKTYAMWAKEVAIVVWRDRECFSAHTFLIRSLGNCRRRRKHFSFEKAKKTLFIRCCCWFFFCERKPFSWILHGWHRVKLNLFAVLCNAEVFNNLRRRGQRKSASCLCETKCNRRLWTAEGGDVAWQRERGSGG